MSIIFIYKTLLLLILFAILISLASGMTFLIKDEGKGERVLNSLKVRITLSILLFVLLIVGIKFGWLRPHELNGQPVGIENPLNPD